MVYSDYYTTTDGEKKNHPVIDYQEGSLLYDDFDFGSLILYRTKALKDAARKMRAEKYLFAGLYSLRLKISQRHLPVHINEYLYTEAEEDTRLSGQKIFDYVDPKETAAPNRNGSRLHATPQGNRRYLKPKFEKIEFDKGTFEYEASVIIPVRNRVKTIKDAIARCLHSKPISSSTSS